MTRRRDHGPLATRLRAHGLALQCAAALTIASLRIATTPRRRLVTALGTPMAASIPPAPDDHRRTLDGATPAEREQLRAATRVGRMVTRVANLLPWHPTCLRQALATRWLLTRRRVPSVLHLGVADPASMDAHAWVTVSGFTVVGRQARPFAAVASFPHTGRAAR